MRFATFNTTILMLLFALPAANGSDLQLPREGSGKIAAYLASPIDEVQDSSYHADGLQLASASPATRFQDECGQCHGEAVEFVRESLTVRNGALIGQYSEMPLVDFLKTHQGLKPADVKFYADLLTRVASEIGLQ
ncbi:MAG: hypothetical protein OEO18_08815 [Gammaproteobacteria bacterium]|nr:hypothetical protein [Gammaproteobacteria bacterium]